MLYLPACSCLTETFTVVRVSDVDCMPPRGFVWEPERNPKDGRDYITFIAEVEGLSAVPDGRVYLNAYINTIEGGLTKSCLTAPYAVIFSQAKNPNLTML